MKFRHINIRNFMWFVPPWIGADRMAVARALDDRLEGQLPPAHDINTFVDFHTYIFVRQGQIAFAPDLEARPHNWFKGIVAFDEVRTPFGASHRLYFCLNVLLRDCPSFEHSHTVYMHLIPELNVPLKYIGLTKQPWHQRFGQHMRDAANGSPYLFHEAIRTHREQPWVTYLIDVGYDYNHAMTNEEARIARMDALYPLGLNMIPGGYAGLRYLHTLGVKARTAQERDEALQRLIVQRDVNGRPNPLCAARWASDQDYINRVICGGPGRLTLEQVRAIRLHSSFGLPPGKIASMFNLSNIAQVARAWAGRTYGRVQ